MGCCHVSSSEGDLIVSVKTQEFQENTTSGHRRLLRFNTSTFVKHVRGNLTDKYNILHVIETGSSSVILEAIERSTGYARAIKCILKKPLTSPEQFKLIDEVECLKILNHQHIVKIFEVIEDETHTHIVTELLRGGELFTKIVRNRRFSESVASLYMRQIFSALMACHEANIAHRDLKPEDIVFKDNEDTSLRIIDFGNTTKHQHIGRTFLGSTYYVAPEVIEGEDSDKCDIWSAGVILYIMLSGEPPFNGSNAQTIFNKILRGVFNFSGDKWTHVSNEAKALIRKMLVKSPECRPSARELLQEPWVQMNGFENENEIDLVSLKCFVQFKAKGMLQQATLAYVASHLMADEDLAYLRFQFMQLDKDQDGKLTINELKEGFQGNQFDWMNIIKECDSNENGVIDYNEFLTASINWKRILSKRQLELAFSAYDADKNGKIDVRELKDFFNDSQFVEGEKVWLNMIEEADLNHDGVIDFTEFEAMMLSHLKNK